MIERAVFISAISLMLTVIAVPLSAQEPMEYIPRLKDSVIDSLIEASKEQARFEQAVTDSIRAEQSIRKEKEKQQLYIDFSEFGAPTGLEEFEKYFHFPPLPQYLTGDCWSFSTTSYFESEIYRLTSREIKLSEMHTVYYEFLEKARRFIEERGDSYFGEGSEGNAVMMVWSRHGAVPADVYEGNVRGGGEHDHSQMTKEMTDYLEYIKASDLWDEELVLRSLRLIMDRYMGRPPERFLFEGKSMTPREYFAEVLRLDLTQYACVMSTMSKPFHEYGEYVSYGNWWHSEDYYNLPIDQFCAVARMALQSGRTLRINGDISEPAYSYAQDLAVVPVADLPPGAITQEARELRIYEKATSDDHDTHVVGFAASDGRVWFLVKDSWRVAAGRFPGYVMMCEDYLRLKVLTYIVNKDVLEMAVPEFEAAR